MNKSLLKEAERTIVNRAVQLKEINKILNALGTFGYKYCSQYVARDDFEKGLAMMRNAVYKEFCEACSNVTIFAGFGGGEAEKFCRDEFKRMFSDDQRYAIMGFLESNGSHPGSYLSSDEQQFREEANEAIKEWDEEGPFNE